MPWTRLSAGTSPAPRDTKVKPTEGGIEEPHPHVPFRIPGRTGPDLHRERHPHVLGERHAHGAGGDDGQYHRHEQGGRPPIRDGKIIGCEIRASSVGDWSVDGATVRAVSIQGSKLADFRCASGSVLRGLRIQGASIKDFGVLDASKLVEILINGSAISDMKLAGTSIAASEIQGSKLADFSMQGCQVKDLMVRMMSLRKTRFTDCALTGRGILRIGRQAWKRPGLKDARFENCRFEKVLFTNCRMIDVVLRNVTLKDRQFRDLDLQGKAIDGEDAFLKAAGVQ